MGMRALRLNQADSAVAEFQRAILAAPNPRFFCELGAAHRLARRPDAARAEFQRALALDPGLADGWVGLSLLAYDRRDYLSAMACSESALARAPYRADAKQLREFAREALGRAHRR